MSGHDLDAFLDQVPYVTSSNHPSLLNVWPQGKNATIRMQIGIFCEDKPGENPRNSTYEADLGFDLLGEISGHERTDYAQIAVENNQIVSLDFSGLPPFELTSTERITSTQDFAGCRLTLYTATPVEMAPIFMSSEANLRENPIRRASIYKA